MSSSELEKQPQQCHTQQNGDATSYWCEEMVTTGIHVMGEGQGRTGHTQCSKAVLFIERGGMQHRRQAAHQVGFFPSSNLLAGADDLLHEVAVGPHARSAHLAVQPQRRAPLPVAVARRYDGAPGARPWLRGALRLLSLVV